jgi:hypothetical protein
MAYRSYPHGMSKLPGFYSLFEILTELSAIRLAEFEHLLIRVMHLLAHHPDLDQRDNESEDEDAVATLSSDPAAGADDEEREDVRGLLLAERRAKIRAKIDADRYRQIAAYLQFYLDAIANVDNVSLLYHVAGRAKTVRDPDGQTYSEVCSAEIIFALVTGAAG